MNKEAIDALHLRARKIGQHFLKHRSGVKNDWANYDGEDLEWELESPTSIKFTWNKYAKIWFRDVSPWKITKEKFHEPAVIKSEVVDGHTSTVSNATSCDQSRTYTVDISSSNTVAQDVGISVMLGFSQKLSIGNEASFYKGEFEFKQEITTNYNKHWENSNESSRTTETSVTIPAGKRVTVTTERKKSTMEQKCEYWCDLNHSMEFYSHGDFRYKLDSIDEFKQIMHGVGVTKGSDWKHKLAKEFKDKGGVDDNHINNIIPSADIHFEHFVKIENATTGNVRITEGDL